MTTVVTLPSKVKVDTKQVFNFCEDRWGSKNLMALVVYGSSLKLRYEDVPVKRRFLWWQWNSVETRRIDPNDIDIAAIYSQPINVNDMCLENSCRIMDEKCDEYSCWWVDSTRFANLHLMCISYDCLVKKKSEDKNLRSVLEDGLLIWGDLPRPMNRLR